MTGSREQQNLTFWNAAEKREANRCQAWVRESGLCTSYSEQCGDRSSYRSCFIGLLRVSVPASNSRVNFDWGYRHFSGRGCRIPSFLPRYRGETCERKIPHRIVRSVVQATPPSPSMSNLVHTSCATVDKLNDLSASSKIGRCRLTSASSLAGLVAWIMRARLRPHSASKVLIFCLYSV